MHGSTRTIPSSNSVIVDRAIPVIDPALLRHCRDCAAGRSIRDDPRARIWPARAPGRNYFRASIPTADRIRLYAASS